MANDDQENTRPDLEFLKQYKICSKCRGEGIIVTKDEKFVECPECDGRKIIEK